jgi:mono/diheme cytochrome c family protein
MKVVLLPLALMFAACGSSGEEALSLPTVDCKSDAGVATFSQVDAFTTCASCHSSKLSGAAARKNAPADINFDVYDSAKAHAEKAVSEVNSGAMPPADSKLTLAESAKDELYRWGLCGTPQD